MGKITYDDKVTMNENASIPAVSKGRAVDWNEIKNVVNDNYDEMEGIQVKTARFSFAITPSSGSTVGTGSTTLDISSLGAKEILGLTFNNGHNWLICGTSTDLTTNPSSLNIYGYRLNGTLTSEILGNVVVMYTK